jgi:hypothetical protein
MHNSFFSVPHKCLFVLFGSHVKLEFSMIMHKDTNSTCLQYKSWSK